jgi:hypothetical protein
VRFFWNRERNKKTEREKQKRGGKIRIYLERKTKRANRKRRVKRERRWE